jgi:hypothetical protein
MKPIPNAGPKLDLNLPTVFARPEPHLDPLAGPLHPHKGWHPPTQSQESQSGKVTDSVNEGDKVSASDDL